MGTTHDEAEVAQIAALLRQAKVEHGHYEANVLRGLDPDWSAWYSGYLLANGLPQILAKSSAPQKVTGNLKALLLDADTRYPLDAVGDDWPTHYARHFLRIAQGREVGA